MRATRQFSDDLLAALRDSRGLRIRAGTGQHRFIGIWVVVVRDRAFVRSWSVKANGWYRTLLEEPRGTIQVADREIAVRAIRTKSEGLRDVVDRAYLDKYSTASALKYAKDLGRAKSRAPLLSSCRCHRLVSVSRFLFKLAFSGSDCFRIAAIQEKPD